MYGEAVVHAEPGCLHYKPDAFVTVGHTGVHFLACNSCHKIIGEWNVEKVTEYLEVCAFLTGSFKPGSKEAKALKAYRPGSLLSKV